MHRTARTSAAVLATFATAGASTLFLGTAPAAAATEACDDGVLIAPGVCEQIVTSGSATFIPSASMTTLEALLVGAGGSGADQSVPNTYGYAAAGGGGEVRIVDLSGATEPLAITVAAPGAPGSITDGVTTEAVANGASAPDDTSTGGDSGNGNRGVVGGTSPGTYGAGAGAGAAPATNADGGAGVVVDAIAPVGSLFAGVTDCYGGGGAIGNATVQGVPGCGGGGPVDAAAAALLAPRANSGGGGGGLDSSQPAADRAGASGIVILRWSAANVSATFDLDAVGLAPIVLAVTPGTAPVPPVDPVAEGYRFDGWFSDAALTVQADFSAPITESTTYYSKWTRVLPTMGSQTGPASIVVGAASLLVGVGLVTMAGLRRRREG